MAAHNIDHITNLHQLGDHFTYEKRMAYVSFIGFYPYN